MRETHSGDICTILLGETNSHTCDVYAEGLGHLYAFDTQVYDEGGMQMILLETGRRLADAPCFDE